MRAGIDKFICGGCWNDCQVVNNIEFARDFIDREYEKLKISFSKGMTVPDVIDFGREDSPLILGGWYDFDEDCRAGCRWTKQEFSILLPEGCKAMEIFAMMPRASAKSDNRGSMDVLIHDEKIETVRLSESEWKRYAITFARPVRELTPCKFKLAGYFCPKEESESQDNRRLGIAISQISFIRE